MDEQNRALVRKYFRKFPRWAIFLAVIGVLLALMGSQSTSVLLVGVAMVALGGYGIYSAVGGKPSDAQMDAWLEEDLARLRQKALSKLGVEAEDMVAEPVSVYGPRLWDAAGAEILWRKGGDGVLRFTPLNVTVINFAKDQLLSYACAYDMVAGNALSESTDEYFYRDVVSVSTGTVDRSVEIKGIGSLQLKEAEAFKLTTSGGTSIEVLIRHRELIKKLGGGEIPTGPMEKAIQSVRKMLREKKASAS